MDRFHFKAAVTLNDGTIAVLCRGRVHGQKELVSTIVLIYKPKRDADGKWTIEHVDTKRTWPTFFPRQLDHLHAWGKKLVTVNDTPNNDMFEAISICLDVTRRKDPHHQKFAQHYICKEVE